MVVGIEADWMCLTSDNLVHCQSFLGTVLSLSPKMSVNNSASNQLTGPHRWTDGQVVPLVYGYAEACLSHFCQSYRVEQPQDQGKL